MNHQRKIMFDKKIFGGTIAILLSAFLVACASSPTPTPVLPTTMPTVAPVAASSSSSARPAQVIWNSTREGKPMSLASGLALDKQGNLYVYDTGYPRVVKYNSDGEFTRLFSFSRGSSDGQFVYAQDGGGIVVDAQNNFYLTDGGNARVQKFDSDGKFMMAFGSKGTDPGQFDFPISIAIDSRGNLLVLDYVNVTIQRFDPSGKFIARYGGKGITGGLFGAPLGIALDNADNMYIADFRNGRLQKLDRTGKFLVEWLECGEWTLRRPTQIAIDKQNWMYVVDSDSNRVCIYDHDGKYVTSWGGTSSSAEGEFKTPYGIVVDETGSIYVSEWGNKRIQKFKLR